jgi:ABC-type bacteriocin/lantibiotic exporter with double-glycine peptidase domain
MTRFLHNTILAFSATTQNHFSTGISWRNIIYRFRTGHVHLYSKITDYVLVDGNRKLLNLLSISMIAIVLLQGHWFKKSVFVMKTGQLIDAKLILGYYKHLLHLPQRF